MGGLHEGLQLAGRYLLTESLRSGGSADVWQARDQHSGVDVALKFSRAGSSAALIAEFRSLKALSHPAIVRAHDVVTDQGQAFLVLDLIDGIEFGQYRGADDVVWLPLVRQVVAALLHAHGRKVAHGDLKLENMLVDAAGRVRLVDFAGRPGAGRADDVRALGQVLSELASGLPSVDRLPPGLAPGLRRLIEDIHADDAAAMSIIEVAGRIDEVLNDYMKPEQAEQFERIEPVARQTFQDRETPVSSGSPQRVWAYLAGAGVIVFALTAVLVLWSRLSPEADSDATSTARDEVTVADQVEQARARLDELASNAQQQSAAVYQKWLTLEAMDVSTWAELRARRAFDLLQEGEKLVSELEHVAALRLLGESSAIFDALLEQAPGIAADRREAGWQAYRSGDAATAAQHFRVSLAIEPDQDDVRAALRRTVFLEQVLMLTRQARELEESGDLGGALAAMNEAYRIDSGNKDVGSEIERLKSQMESNEFQSTMSAYYAAMQRNDRSAARGFLAKASKSRPGSPEVRDARTQLELADRAARTSSLRTRATAAEDAEDWDTAIELYSELLRIDPALVLAQQGRDRSRRLAALTTHAESMLNTALVKDDVRREADELLQQIAGVNAEAPSLRSLAGQLEDALRLSRLPVTVRFQSDNLTEVQVQRVARLGTFDRHELDLMPGQYTIVGKRVGYRDVRAELTVEAGKQPEPLFIRCEEQI